jgi:hypothetical protein
MKVQHNGMPALNPWLEERYRDMEGLAADDVKSLEDIFMIGIALQAKVGKPKK